MADPVAPSHGLAEIQSSRRLGAHWVVSLAVRGVAERVRPGNFVEVSVPGHSTRRALWIHRVRRTSSLGATLEVIVDPASAARRWLISQPVGTQVALTGPLGRPFALPSQAVPCVLVGHGRGGAALEILGERLKERRCSVNVLLAAEDEASLFGATEVRRWARSVTVVTTDGSVGMRGSVAEHLPDALRRFDAAVVYAAGPNPVLHDVAVAAEAHGAWSQVALEIPSPCGTGLCHGCPLPVVTEDGVVRTMRACVEGPVVRGDRLRWDALGTGTGMQAGAS